jgi:EAL domain-containing protein (putative c-di-GMP-specific phosphodiesterase class I)
MLQNLPFVQTAGVSVVILAEGVETEAQRAFLEEYGCTLYQEIFV